MAFISYISAARQLSEYEPPVFEATDSIGGVWRHCSCKSNKLVQTPRCDYEFSDYPWPERDNSSCPSHDEILEYSQSYATHFDVLKFVGDRETADDVGGKPGDYGSFSSCELVAEDGTVFFKDEDEFKFSVEDSVISSYLKKKIIEEKNTSMDFYSKDNMKRKFSFFESCVFEIPVVILPPVHFNRRIKFTPSRWWKPRMDFSSSEWGEDAGLRKGPWTPEEDLKLIHYIQTHGHGNWSALPKLAGLDRCGKSCRLRWKFFFRPDINRGKFSQEEEQTILDLHSILGNKWSSIATHLPGRTENEIKNFWNNYLEKKKLIQMGIYPMTHRPRTDLFFSMLQEEFVPSSWSTGKTCKTSTGLTSEYDPNVSYLGYENGIKSGFFTIPDSQHDQPNCKDADVEIGKILRQAGALRARDLPNHNSHHDTVYLCREGCHKPSHNPIKAILKLRREYMCGVLLLMSALVATMTYRAAFSLRGGTLKDGYSYHYAANDTIQLKKQDSVVNRSFILFNSTGFVASVAVIIFLLHDFPLKPWPQISVSTMFGSYMCLIMAISPQEAFPVLVVAIPFLLLAAAGKLLGFARPRS
ncbi:uncharacterized protein LOC132270659 [Cornus florida]|uniref:uncharacterized protein LOC132270659 n=1 Tax=Cornus florida TaxID=4283 RepID=UPI00289EDA4C|nr:uncharacterized protein LOC132270659 [Cornus florida]